MVKLPIVNIYSAIPDFSNPGVIPQRKAKEQGPKLRGGWKSVLLTLSGKSVGREYLKSFKYTYTREGDDKGFFILAFDTPKISIEPFRQGNPLFVEWGYAGGYLLKQLVSVDKLQASYTSRGLILTVNFISYAGDSAKHPSGAVTVAEFLTKQNLTITYSYLNPLTKVTNHYIIQPKTGFRSWAQEWEEESKKHYESVQEKLKSKEKKTNWILGSQVSVSPGPTPSGFKIGPGVDALPRANLEYLNQSLTEFLQKFLLKISKDIYMGTRNDAIVITDDVSKQPPKFGVTPSNVISATFKELPKKLATDYVSSFQVDPTTGDLKTTAVTIRAGSKYQIYNSKGRVVGEWPIIYQDGHYGLQIEFPEDLADFQNWGVPLPHQERDNPNTPSKFRFFQFPPELEKDFKKWMEEQEQDDKLEAANKRATEPLPKENVVDAHGNFIRQIHPYLKTVTAHEEEGYKKFFAGQFTEEDLGFDKKKAHITYRVNPLEMEDNINRIVNERLKSFFQATGITLVVEGSTFYEGDFNFALVDFIKELNGLFVSLEVSHIIQSGKYTTSILGGKVPAHVSEIAKGVKQTLEKATKEIIEKYNTNEEALQFFNNLISIDEIKLWDFKAGFSLPGVDPITGQWFAMPGDEVDPHYKPFSHFRKRIFSAEEVLEKNSDPDEGSVIGTFDISDK